MRRVLLSRGSAENRRPGSRRPWHHHPLHLPPPFYLKSFPTRFLRDRTDSKAAWDEVAGDIEGSDYGTFWLLTKEALERNVFTRLLKDEINQRDIIALLRMALRMEDQRLKWHSQMTENTRVHQEGLEFYARKEQREKNAALFAKIYAAQAAAHGSQPTSPPQPAEHV